MNTVVVKIEENQINGNRINESQINQNQINDSLRVHESLYQAASILKDGGMVAFPTETVYGLGADALQETAAKQIYAAKGRPSDNPLIVHIADFEQLAPLVQEIPQKAKKLIDVFWPGPLTLIFRKSAVVPKGTTGGLDTVAVRMPSNQIALAVIREAGVPVAAPSANTSGRPSPTLAMHVYEDLNGRIPMIIDGGMVNIGIESTIVDVTCEPPMILRPGYITQEMLSEVVGEVTIDPALTGPMNPEIAPKAPGMKYKHYAPKADFTMYMGTLDLVVDKINEMVEMQQNKGYKVGIIACDETVTRYPKDVTVSIGSRKDGLTISQNLYRILREFDEKEVDFIYGETFEETALGQAIMNRLLKAAGYQVERIQ
jgi:L-threonylcarbamoyladenylate synthase